MVNTSNPTGSDAMTTQQQQQTRFQGQVQGQGQQGQQQFQAGEQVTWASMKLPGAYVDQQTGELYRVPAEALLGGASPVIHRESSQPEGGVLIRISPNPYVPTNSAKMLAAQLNVEISF